MDSLADLSRSFNVYNGTSTNYRAFYARIDRPEFPIMMKMFFYTLLEKLAVEVLEPSENSLLIYFKDILIQDGSSSSLKGEHKKVRANLFHCEKT